jgi:acetoin utilization deacetylase AcuC-like enzyme
VRCGAGCQWGLAPLTTRTAPHPTTLISVALSLPIVWSDAVLRHAPGAEVWVGVRMPDDELPERATIVRDALVAEGATVVPAEAHPDAAVEAVHDPALVAFLRDAHASWLAAGLHEDPGQDLVVPYLFPTQSLLGDVAPHRPEAVWARTGFFCFDTMTPIGPGTWEAARGAVDCTLTAIDLVRSGATAAFAITRPPGHHVSRSAYGGSCYLNNAAIAAQALRDAGAARVAIVDVDAHHGNGAQQIFWERGDVLTASVHVDPAAGWFPHVMGWADETGAGPGAAANRNVPVDPGTGDAGWLAALGRCLDDVRIHGSEAIVLALGVDAATGDPNSPLEATAAGYREAGRRIGALGLPVVAVLEGGYDPLTLGGLVTAALAGVEEGLADG